MVGFSCLKEFEDGGDIALDDVFGDGEVFVGDAFADAGAAEVFFEGAGFVGDEEFDGVAADVDDGDGLRHED